MEKYILGIDIGTGSIKSVAVSSNGTAIADNQIHYLTDSPQPGFSEQNAEVIWQTFIKSVQQIIDTLQYPPQAVCLSSAMHSVIAVDKNGNALYPLITWADTRSTDIAERIRNFSPLVYTRTGTPIHSMTPLCKIIWIKENIPDLFSNTAKFISIKEYIWHQLFGEFKIDYSIASATGLFNITQLQWDDEALSLAGISNDKLSEPVTTHYSNSSMAPEIASRLHLPSDTPFIIGASDGCLANVGSFAMSQGIAALTIGTSGAVRIASEQPIVNPAAMIFNYCLDDHTFICGGPVNNGGNAVDWLLKNFLNKPEVTATDYQKLFDEVATIQAGSEGLLFLPYLYGERAPIWDGKSCGVFVGIRSQHTQSHFLRAVIEGICFALNEVVQVIDATQPIQQLNVSGGFIHSRIWVQLLADITGKKISLVQTEDASTIGAAYFAMKALGWIRNYESLNTVSPTYLMPDVKNHKMYEQYFSVYTSLYQQLKTSMHQLLAITSNTSKD